ncbi:MAG TPA: hypothetical protein VLC10_00345 [Patescibacteria group bacterium]|nr:hypothetical protein [Patescibacteria group bacterium]
MPPWVRKMSDRDIDAAKALAAANSEPQIVRMAASCLRKAQRIGFWFGASCLVPVAVLAAPAFRPAIIAGDFWLWLAALVAAMTLPLPALEAARRCSGQGNVIAYAFWLKKDPSRLSRD